jgi:hypothetical protein
MSTQQRDDWNGLPAGARRSVAIAQAGLRPSEGSCLPIAVPLVRWELRLEANGELIASQVCRNNEQVLTTQEQWKKLMIEKGWT